MPTPEEIAELKSLQEVFNLSNSTKKIETYSKWLFATTTIIASLGAGLADSSARNLTGYGNLSFSVALIVLGISLGCAALSLAPTWHEISRHVLSDLRNAASNHLNSKKLLIQISSWSFTIALVLASLSPFISKLSTKKEAVAKGIGLNYSLTQECELKASLVGTGAKPFSRAEIELVVDPPAKPAVWPITVGMASSSGTISLSLSAKKLRQLKGTKILLLRGRWKNKAGAQINESLSIPILR